MSDITVGHYVAGTIGAAILRRWYRDGAINAARFDELAALIRAADDPPFTLALNPERRELDVGYAEWSATYDGPNPLIDIEQPLVRESLAQHAGAGVRALDAGCGTGRHAAFLADAGCEVVGTDASAEMLDVARAKVPQARFEVAEHDALPLDDDSIDLAVAALTLCHLAEPAPAIVELGRVIRSDGTLVISDPHPAAEAIGGQAFYGEITPGEPMAWVENHYRGASEWLAAFRAGGFEVVDCREPPVSEAQIASAPLTPFYPDAVRQLWADQPALWLWELRRT